MVSACRAWPLAGRALAANGLASIAATALFSLVVSPATPARPVWTAGLELPLVCGLAVVPSGGRPLVSTPVPDPEAVARLPSTALSLIAVLAPIAPPAAWASPAPVPV